MGRNGMSVLGLAPEEEEIYRHFLRNPKTSADEIHLLLHTPPEVVRDALDRLQSLGLLRRSDEGDVSPADPETALDGLTDLRLQELHQEFRHVTRARRLLVSLREEQGGATASPQGVERVESVDQIRNRIDDLAFFAREEILSVEPHQQLTPENIEHARPLDLRCLRRGVRIRNVVRKDAVRHPLTAGYLRELTSHGALIRASGDTAERLLVYDRRVALVPVDPANTARGALVAHEGGLVANIVALFEKIWEQAEDFPSVAGEVAGEAGLSKTEQRVLESMCRVGKDETGARDLGMSVRTYRRHVADLLRTLGASSRAQAALLARERGWV